MLDQACRDVGVNLKVRELNRKEQKTMRKSDNQVLIYYLLVALTLSHLGDLIHSQPGGADSAPLRNFGSLDSN